MRKKVFKGKKEKKKGKLRWLEGHREKKNVFAKWNQNNRSQRESMNAEGKIIIIIIMK